MPSSIDQAFTYHRPDEAGVFAIETVRNAARRLAQTIDAYCPDGREKALAITKVEEAMMWASAAVARHGAGFAAALGPGDDGPADGPADGAPNV